MKVLKIGICLGAVVWADVLLGGTCVWNPVGSGGWAEDGRWLENKAPGAGDVVEFRDCTGIVTKADAPTLAKIASVKLTGSGSGLVMSNDAEDGDFEFGKPVAGDGVLIKRGTGVTRMTYAETAVKTGYWMAGGLEVLEGTLVLPRSPSTDLYLTKLTVMAPGVFMHTGNSYTRIVNGLWGNGTVSNDVSKPMYISGGTAQSPAVFSGRFTGMAYPCLQSNGTASNLVQYFTGVDSDCTRDFLLYMTDGVAGFAKFGNTADGAKGSVGRAQQTLYYRGQRGRMLYLGDGETVTKTIGFGTGTQEAILDAGEHGGLTFNGTFSVVADQCNHMNALTLDGNGENVINVEYATVTNPAGRDVAHYVTKEGNGSWRFTAGKKRTMIGTLEVKKGDLKFDSIAERGTDCAVGPANLTQSKYTGSYNANKPQTRDIDDSKTVPYAFLLGNGEDAADDAHLATLNYTGDANADIRTRAIAVRGAGRLKTSTAQLAWAGITSAAAGEHSIVLENDAAHALSVVVTNGCGTMGVVKQGEGRCVLGAGSVLSGELQVKGGELRVPGGKYEWYRFTVTETWNYATNALGQTLGGNGGPVTMRQFALMDDRGENQILNLVHNKAADGASALLAPGEAAIGCTDYRVLGTDDHGRNVTWALSNLFTTAATYTGLVRVRYTSSGTADQTYRGVDTDSSRHISVIIRLPTSAKPVTHYDIRCQGYWPDDSSAGQRMPRAWTLEGSVDGVAWDLLSTVTTNDNTYANIPTGSYGRWYSNNSTTQGKGYGPVATETSHGGTAVHPSSVAVSAGAKLNVAGGSVLADGISYDCSAGRGGTLSGVAFSSEAVVRLSGLQKDQFGTLLPLTLENCTGYANRPWNVEIDGVPVSSCSARVGADGIRVQRMGFTILFR